MANATNGYLVATFTGPGTGADVLLARNVRADLRKLGTVWITGTFVGTVTLEGSPPGANSFGAVSGGSWTGPTSAMLSLGADEDLRFNCTAFTSGTISCFLHVTN